MPYQVADERTKAFAEKRKQAVLLPIRLDAAVMAA
jgi:hypothetical protein